MGSKPKTRCRKCGGEKPPGRCPVCKSMWNRSEAGKAYYKKYRADHPGKIKRISRKYYVKPEKRALNQRNGRNLVLHKKIRTIVHYGGKCSCPGCDERRIEFLAIDHVEGGGSKHRREIGNSCMYVWLRKNGFPLGFRVLCHNCNMARGFYGYCPHEQESQRQEACGPHQVPPRADDCGPHRLGGKRPQHL